MAGGTKEEDRLAGAQWKRVGLVGSAMDSRRG